ncbi:hypothetical protein ACOSQ2_010439 [Xanthoceras sorbifolium]
MDGIENEENGVRDSTGFCDLDGDDIEWQISSDEGDDAIVVGKYQWNPNPNGSIDFEEEQVFGNAKLVRKAVKQYAIQEGFMLTKIKNDRTRYTIWPRVKSQYCFGHIIENLRATLKNLNIIGKLWAASRLGDSVGFKEVIESIKNNSVKEYDYLMKSDHNTNNMCECFKSWINEDRDKPILTLFESLRRKVMVMFHEKWEEVEKFEDDI